MKNLVYEVYIFFNHINGKKIAKSRERSLPEVYFQFPSHVDIYIYIYIFLPCILQKQDFDWLVVHSG